MEILIFFLILGISYLSNRLLYGFLASLPILFLIVYLMFVGELVEIKDNIVTLVVLYIISLGVAQIILFFSRKRNKNLDKIRRSTTNTGLDHKVVRIIMALVMTGVFSLSGGVFVSWFEQMGWFQGGGGFFSIATDFIAGILFGYSLFAPPIFGLFIRNFKSVFFAVSPMILLLLTAGPSSKSDKIFIYMIIVGLILGFFVVLAISRESRDFLKSIRLDVAIDFKGKNGERRRKF